MGRSSHAFGSPLLLLLLSLGCAAAQKGTTWKTLNGNAPLIIAKGGFSGLFPDSSGIAYHFVVSVSPDAALWCDIQLTKDDAGICLPNIKMDSCTDIANGFPQEKKTYNVNGVSMTGWFAVDYKSTTLSQVHLKQCIQSRGPYFDGTLPIVPVEAVFTQFKAPAVWLNVQHDSFYNQFNLSMRRYILSVSTEFIVDYISSSEVNFLTIMSQILTKKLYFLKGIAIKKPTLVFRFLDMHSIEPSTKQTYGSLLKNLTFITTFASGIIVPKTYIWPVTKDSYLLPSTSIVDDAHKAGLEIYAADFANDFDISYNYSYDPLTEYLSFIDNGAFCVDGVLTDFPITPSEAIGCFSNVNNSKTDHGIPASIVHFVPNFTDLVTILNSLHIGPAAKPLVISHNGASGDYPDCTDQAYEKAVADGADIIDCPVQVTKDGIPICMSSIDLTHITTVEESQFVSQEITIKELMPGPGVFTFNLTWDDISKILKPMISNPMSTNDLFRNPRNKNSGNFMRFSDFLSFAKGKDLSGIMINIEHAAFMAEKLGFDVVDAVIEALDESGYSKQAAQKVMIQSTNSSVLVKFKEAKCNLVYMIEKDVRDATPSSLAEIKKFADAVSVRSTSIFPMVNHFLTDQDHNLVQSLQSAGLEVYVYLLMNEFVSQPYDFFSDATSQINAYVQGAKVDGVITDFPGTAHRYKLNTCMNLGKNAPAFMQPLPPGVLLSTITPPAQPPAMASLPLLTISDIGEPPLPAVIDTAAALGMTEVSVLVTLLLLYASLLM